MQDDPANSENLDAIRELRRSAGWGLVQERISGEIDRWADELTQPGLVERRSDLLRGQIGALRTVLEIPKILEDEFKEEE
jgi:hypothetical protein